MHKTSFDRGCLTHQCELQASSCCSHDSEIARLRDGVPVVVVVLEEEGGL